MATLKKIKLSDLLINTENYRFEPVASQKEAIDQMVADQGEKLYNLAEHIIKNGLNPNDRIQAVPSNHDKTKYNVLEGNRRTVALKLLMQPDLIDDNVSLRKKFRKLHDDNKSDIIKLLECTVYDNPAEADKWIKLKHAGQSDGVGTVAWNAQQVQRFEEKVEGKSSIALQTLKLLEKDAAVPPEVKSNLNKLKITNLDRLLSDPYVRDFLGIEINGGVIQSDVDQREVIKGIARIAVDLLDPDFNVKKIYTKEDRRDYVNSLPKKYIPNTKIKAAKPWQAVTAQAAAASKAKKVKPNPKDRDLLIPKSCALKISNPKVNAIYHELQKLSVTKYTNAVSVLFRVFVELSLDTFIDDNKLTTVTLNDTLNKKVEHTSMYLETNKLADRHMCKGIRHAVQQKNDLLGIETWHAYVHNPRFRPNPSHLTITWDNIQIFMEKIWENIK